MKSAPRDIVDRIFTRLLARYGTAWTRMWQGLDPDAVKADWAHVLVGYANDPRAIRHALENLPSDWPPNAMQFRDLCRGAPPRPLNGLEAPKPDPALAAAARERVGRIIATTCATRGAPSRLRWAIDLHRREGDGERLSIFQRTIYREALGVRDGDPETRLGEPKPNPTETERSGQPPGGRGSEAVDEPRPQQGSPITECAPLSSQAARHPSPR